MEGWSRAAGRQWGTALPGWPRRPTRRAPAGPEAAPVPGPRWVSGSLAPAARQVAERAGSPAGVGADRESRCADVLDVPDRRIDGDRLGVRAGAPDPDDVGCRAAGVYPRLAAKRLDGHAEVRGVAARCRARAG